MTNLSYHLALNTSGDISGDLYDLSHNDYYTVSLSSGSGNITGHIANATACRKATTNLSVCYLRILGDNTVTGDLRSYLDNTTFLNNFEVDIRGQNTVSLASSDKLERVLHVTIVGAGMSQTSVDNILVGLDKNGLSYGTVDLSGNNPAPSGTGAAAVASLQSKGWSVTVTP